MTDGIFIGYRRSISSAAAGRLYDRLTEKFHHLFMDVDSIAPGIDFVQTVDEQVSRCRVFLAIIGPGWADAVDEHGRRRLDDPDDYVRFELQTALRRKTLIIPVLVDGGRMPNASELPDDLKELARKQAFELAHHRFSADVTELVKILTKILPPEVVRATGSSATVVATSDSYNPRGVAETIFGFKGRISRKVYWKYIILYYLISALGSLAIDAGVVVNGMASGLSLGQALASLQTFVSFEHTDWRVKALLGAWTTILTWPYCALILKRMHDFDQGLGMLIPILLINFGGVVAFMFGFIQIHFFVVVFAVTVIVLIGFVPGSVARNKFGPGLVDAKQINSRAASIPSKRKRWPIFTGATALVFLTTAVVLIFAIGLPRKLAVSIQPSRSVDVQTPTWIIPAEWVVYAIDGHNRPFLYRPASIQRLGSRVSYLARYPVQEHPTSSTNDESVAVYEDDTTIVDCDKSTWALADRTLYSDSGQSLAHFRLNDLSSTNLSDSAPIQAGTIVGDIANLLCHQELLRALVPKAGLQGLKLSYLSPTPDGDGDFWYGTPIRSTDPNFEWDVLTIIKFRMEKPIAPGVRQSNPLYDPGGFRTLAEILEMNCKDRRARVPVAQNFDREQRLVSLNAPSRATLFEIVDNSPLGLIRDSVCKGSIPDVRGTYVGENKVAYAHNGQGEQKISIIVEQTGSSVRVSFTSPTGGRGEGEGQIIDSKANNLAMKSTNPSCPGSYVASFSFDGSTLSWTYTGEDCVGSMEGHGTATKVS